jgi:hypothetical protein
VHDRIDCTEKIGDGTDLTYANPTCLQLKISNSSSLFDSVQEFCAVDPAACGRYPAVVVERCWLRAGATREMCEMLFHSAPLWR